MAAALRGSSRVVKLLLSKGASVSAADDYGFTPLIASARSGHLEVVGLLVTAGSDLEASTVEGVTALCMAVFNGHSEVVRALIASGADVNSRRPNGATPLVEAAYRGRIPPIRELLRAKANPQLTLPDVEGGAAVALDLAAQFGHLDAVRELVSQVGIGGCGGPTGGIKALCLAAQGQRLDMMVMLMQEIGVVDDGTALIAATQNGREASVKLLLQQLQQQPKRERAAAVDARDVCGRTPLVCTILFSISARLARMLVDAGANTASAVAIKDPSRVVVFDETPLALTCSILAQEMVNGRDATEKQLNGLEAIRRLLLRVEAVHAVSWLWLRHAAPPAEGGKRSTSTSAPLTVMVPIVKRRVARRGVLLTTIFRHSVKP